MQSKKRSKAQLNPQRIDSSRQLPSKKTRDQKKALHKNEQDKVAILHSVEPLKQDHPPDYYIIRNTPLPTEIRSMFKMIKWLVPSTMVLCAGGLLLTNDDKLTSYFIAGIVGINSSVLAFSIIFTRSVLRRS